jgi:hypothetical protein
MKKLSRQQDLEDQIMNAITVILWKLEAENHPDINEFIDRCNKITKVLIKHKLIPNRNLYPKHKEK